MDKGDKRYIGFENVDGIPMDGSVDPADSPVGIPFIIADPQEAVKTIREGEVTIGMYEFRGFITVRKESKTIITVDGVPVGQ